MIVRSRVSVIRELIGVGHIVDEKGHDVNRMRKYEMGFLVGENNIKLFPR